MEPNFKIPEFYLRMKELPEFKNAVIAGGYVRDSHLGREVKDIDVFFPRPPQGSMTKLFDHLGISKEVSKKNMKKYVTSFFSSKYDAVIDGMEVDFVVNTLPDNEAFGWSLLETFNYGLDMCFTNGEELFLSDDFNYDVKNSYLRLINLEGIHNLPHVMEKYARLKAKYPEYEFTSDYVLERRKGAGWV